MMYSPFAPKPSSPLSISPSAESHSAFSSFSALRRSSIRSFMISFSALRSASAMRFFDDHLPYRSCAPSMSDANLSSAADAPCCSAYLSNSARSAGSCRRSENPSLLPLAGLNPKRRMRSARLAPSRRLLMKSADGSVTPKSDIFGFGREDLSFSLFQFATARRYSMRPSGMFSFGPSRRIAWPMSSPVSPA